MSDAAPRVVFANYGLEMRPTGRDGNDRSEGWDEPVPLSRRADLPSFPVASFPDWLRHFVVAEAEATQTPVDMASMFALAAISTCAAGRIQVEPKEGWIEGVNVFIVVAMEPGSRKSSVHRDIFAPVHAYEQHLAEQARPEIVAQKSRQRIAAETLKKKEGDAARAKKAEDRQVLLDDALVAAEALEQVEVPEPPRMFTDDVTPEKLVTLLHENGGRIALLSAEGGVFGMMAGRYSRGDPNLDVYLKGHAGDPIRVDRRGRPPEYVANPALTVGLAVQPFVLSKAARQAELNARGLLQRFLYALPIGTVGYRKIDAAPVPDAARYEFDQAMRTLAATMHHLSIIQTLHLSSEAADALGVFRTALEPRQRREEDLGHVQAWASKLDGAVVRISGLLHIARMFDSGWDAPISGPTMRSAIDIGSYLIAHALAAFDQMGGDPAIEGARRVLTWIRKEHTTTFTKRECYVANRSVFQRANKLDPVLALLEDLGAIREELTEPRVGRPSRRFAVNPSLFTQKPQKTQNGL